MQGKKVAVEVHHADGRILKQEYRHKYLLETLQAIVEGDVERVILPGLGEGKIAIVNEDGKALGLPVNKSMPIFVGDVVIMDDADLD